MIFVQILVFLSLHSLTISFLQNFEFVGSIQSSYVKFIHLPVNAVILSKQSFKLHDKQSVSFGPLQV
jgi:hypothetical protein